MKHKYLQDLSDLINLPLWSLCTCYSGQKIYHPPIWTKVPIWSEVDKKFGLQSAICLRRRWRSILVKPPLLQWHLPQMRSDQTGRWASKKVRLFQGFSPYLWRTHIFWMPIWGGEFTGPLCASLTTVIMPRPPRHPSPDPHQLHHQAP